MAEATDFNSALRDDAVLVLVEAGTVVDAPEAPTDFRFDFARSDIQTFERVGDDLVIILENGQVARITDYYLSAYEHALVFQDESDAAASTSGLILPIGGLLAAGAGAAALAGGGGGGASGPNIDISGDNGGADGVVSDAELQNGLTITGTATPGVDVDVSLSSSTLSTVADGNGNWSVTFPEGDVPKGELDLLVNAVATDANGNVGTDNETVQVDTVVSDLAIEDLPGDVDADTGQSVVNMEDVADPTDLLLVTGTVEAGATSVEVEFAFNGKTYPAVVDADGNWTAEVPAADFPTVDATAFDVTVTAQDAAGNVGTTTGSLIVDTVFTGPTITQMPGDANNGLVNADMIENAPNGVVIIGGEVEPGSTVTVTVLGTEYTDVAGSDGNWSVEVPVGVLPDGDGASPITVSATAVDPNGNTSAPVTDSFMVDNQIGDVTVVDDGTGGDGTVNAEEAGNGLTLTGDADPGATITVKINEITVGTGVADGNGDWQVTIPASALPDNDQPLDISITATDEAGNTTELDDNIEVTLDTTPPDVPMIIFDGGGNTEEVSLVGFNQADVTALVAQEGQDAMSLLVPNGSGGATKLTSADFEESSAGGTLFYTLDDAVASLIVSVEDDAGNMQSSFTVFSAEQDGSVPVLNGLANDGLNITTIDLTEEAVQLTLDKSDVDGLTGAFDKLTIVGDGNDQLTLTGFSEGAARVDGNGNVFTEYTLGETMVWVDDDITSVVT